MLEIVSGKAPAASSIIRYNQRGPAVLSYVSQFAEPPAVCGLESLAHRAIHSILRLPLNSLLENLRLLLFFVLALIRCRLFRIVLLLGIGLLFQRPPI